MTAGSGIATDPYVIRGWDINASSVNGITIANTTVYFTIDSNSIHNGIRGIFLTNVTHGLIQNSDVESNRVGVLLDSSPSITISNDRLSYNVQAIVANNSQRIIVSGNTVSFQKYNDIAILLNSAPNSVVTGNNVYMNSGGGIYVQTSANVLLSDNTVSSNSYGTGVHIYQSPGAAISNNNVTRNNAGIDISMSGNVTVLSNQFSWNILGLEIGGNNTVSNNTFSFDTVGIVCACSGTNMTIRGNGFAYDGLTLDTYIGTYVPSFNITGNLVNNKPMLFYKDCSNIIINSVPVGQLIAVNCRNLQIRNVQITNTVVGAQLVNVNNATIMNNSINSNSQGGIELSGSNITIAFNNISNNLRSSAIAPAVQSMLVHHNNFIYNSASGNGGGVWDNGVPSGGNFWSDYVGVDNCSGPSQNICPSPDGIGDTPFQLVGQPAEDRYPLIRPYLLTPDTTPPTWLPGNTLIASNSSATGMTLSWTMAADDVGISYYQLYEGSKIVSTQPAVLDFDSILLSRYISGLTPGTVYSFKVEAVDWAGNPSTNGPSLTLTTQPNSASGIAWWIQNWYLVAITGVAIGGATATMVFLRARKKAMRLEEKSRPSTRV